LKGEIKKCIEDQNGNHVIQKLIERLPKGQHNEILKVIKGKVILEHNNISHMNYQSINTDVESSKEFLNSAKKMKKIVCFMKLTLSIR